MHRKFGVEIEFGGSIEDAIQAIADVGLSSRNARYGYIGNSDTEFVVKEDGSVSNGGELVSPPLWFDSEDDRAKVTSAVDAIRNAGCRPMESCGVHVHVDASDLTVPQVAAVVRSFHKFEDVIYRLASSGWTTIRRGAQNYAYPLGDDYVERLVKARTLNELARAWYNESDERYVQSSMRNHGDSSRYSAINLHSYFYRKTIEFRVFNSTLNPERVQAYIALCMGLVADAVAGNRRSIKKRYPLGSMHDGTTKEANAFHRFQQVLRYDAGMSLVDMKRMTMVWKDSRPQSDFFPNRRRLSYR
jgi:hypothetical protein